MKNKKVLLIGTLILSICLVGIFNALAHSGRTDSNGGHRDNKNQSGLGYYHYHCGGYPAHLHTGGVCPYKTKVYSSSSSSSSSSSYDDGIDVGYEKGYDEGNSEGYYEGHTEGYDEGYDEGYKEGYDEGYYEGHEEGFAEGFDKQAFVFRLILVASIVVAIIIVKLVKKRRKE